MFFAAKGPTTTSYIWTDPLERVAEVIQRTGRHYEYDLLWAIAEKAPEGIYFDVGAHVGNHTSFFALECPSTKVIAVEPHQETVGFCARRWPEIRLRTRCRSCPQLFTMIGKGVGSSPRMTVEESSQTRHKRLLVCVLMTL